MVQSYDFIQFQTQSFENFHGGIDKAVVKQRLRLVDVDNFCVCRGLVRGHNSLGPGHDISQRDCSRRSGRLDSRYSNVSHVASLM